MGSVEEVYDRIMNVATQAEADEQLEKLVQLIVEEGKSRRLAKKIAKKNIGYYAGYSDEQTARRVWRLYRTEHPIFKKRWPKPTEAFRLGVKWGKKKV